MTIEITKQTKDFSTAPQISAEDVAQIAALGFKTIINNRPDFEGGETQPLNVQIQAAAQALGLQYVYIPVIPNNIQASEIDAFKTAFASVEKPVLAFCRTGNRANNLYKLAQSSV
jgi:uncharacterized protein (TIGR01244 family)